MPKAAESIGPDFVFSRKPNPAVVAMDDWVPALVEKEFDDVLEAVSAPTAVPSSSRSRTSAPAGRTRGACGSGARSPSGAPAPRFLGLLRRPAASACVPPRPTGSCTA
ncbi:MAG: hypothetical protein U0838_09290 [Chloroflexota bacterium]